MLLFLLLEHWVLTPHFVELSTHYKEYHFLTYVYKTVNSWLVSKMFCLPLCLFIHKLALCVYNLHCTSHDWCVSVATSSFHSAWHISNHSEFFCSSASCSVKLNLHEKLRNCSLFSTFTVHLDIHWLAINLLMLHQGARCTKNKRETVYIIPRDRKGGTDDVLIWT